VRAGPYGADCFGVILYTGAGVCVKEGMATVRRCYTVIHTCLCGWVLASKNGLCRSVLPSDAMFTPALVGVSVKEGKCGGCDMVLRH